MPHYCFFVSEAAVYHWHPVAPVFAIPRLLSKLPSCSQFLQFLGVDHLENGQSLYLGLKGVTCTFCRAFYVRNLLLCLGQAREEDQGKKIQDGEMFGTGPSNLVLLSSHTGC